MRVRFISAVCGGVCAVAASGSAHAADLPIKARPAAVVSPMWTGFYVGGNFGYSFGRARSAVPEGELTYFSRLAPAGMTGGGQAGYRYQHEWLVIGAEADIQWSGQNSTLCSVRPDCTPLFTSPYRNSRLNWFGTLRGVVGVAHDNWLWTVTGGYAYGDAVDEAGGFALGNGLNAYVSERATRQGWTVGTAVETRLWQSNWSVKLEYLYLDLGRHTVQPVCTTFNQAGGSGIGCPGLPLDAVPASAVTTHLTDHVVRVGLNYNIGGSQPISAPTPTPPLVANWAGFYAGGNVGYGVGHDQMAINRFRPDDSLQGTFLFPQSPGGIIGGAQAGYRFQHGWLVAGAEADFQLSNQKDASCTSCSDIHYSDQRDWFGTVRGVAGVAQGASLWYVTGGFAYSRVAIDQTREATQPIVGGVRTDLTGWTVGAGVETRLWASNWSVKLEYLYLDFGHVSFNAICTEMTANQFGLRPGPCHVVDNAVSDHVVRVGLNYQFH